MRHELPDELFRYVDGETDVAQEGDEETPIDDIRFDSDGIRVYLEGAAYYQKGVTMPDAMYAFNLAKRHFIEPIKFLNKWYFYPGMIISAFNITRMITIYNDMTWRFAKPYLYKKSVMTSMPAELEDMIYTFLVHIGCQGYQAEQFSAIVAHMIELDSAYRLRSIDIISETSIDKLINNPRKELKRMMVIMKDREDSIVTEKFFALAKLLTTILLIPKFKNAFISAVSQADIKKMQYDEIDRYWAGLRKDGYKYRGMSDEERREELREEGKSLPIMIKRKKMSTLKI